MHVTRNDKGMYSGVPNNRVDVFVFPVLEMHARLDYLEQLVYIAIYKKVVTSIIQTNLLISLFTKKSPTFLFGTNSIVKELIIILIFF